MRLKSCFIVFLGIMWAVTGWSAWMPLTPGADSSAPVSINVESEVTETLMNVSITGLQVNDVQEKGISFSKIDIPDAGKLSKPGSPLVPAIRKNIIVPADARVSLEVNVIAETSLKDYSIYPAQPSVKRDQEQPPFTLNQAVYSHDAFFPAEIARISDEGFLRDFRFVTVTITPVQTNPVTGELRVITDLQVNVVTEGGSSEMVSEVFPSFRSVYENSLDNFGSLNIGTRSDAEPMLIICHDTMLSDMASFVEWKTKRGIDVTMVSSTETGTSSSALQTYIQNVWASWDPQPVFIILVGDAPQLEPLTGIGSCASDSMFTLLEGSDDYPDTFISRLCAQNSSELLPQLDKLLTYEMTPVDGDWLNKFAGLASSEGSDPSDEEYSQEVEARLLDHNPDATADRIYASQGHGATEISAAVNEGLFWVSYFGHGSGTSWSSPGFTNSNVDSLNNGYMTPFIMDVSCSNGSFDSGSDCFAERWIKGDGHGAVSMYSSTTSTAWDEPAVMAWGVTYSVAGDSTGAVPGGDYLFGQMTYNGISYMYDDMGTGSNTVEVMNQYVLFGDCSAMFRSDAFVTPDVTHLPTAPMAEMPFEVTVSNGGTPVEGAFVCAYKVGEVHEVAQTDATGLAILNIAPTTIGDMIITVYGQNIYPQESIVMVAPAGCGIVVLDRTGYNCSDTVIMRVFDADVNANPGVVETVDVDISSDTETTPEIVTLTETGPDTAEFSGTIMTSDSQGGVGYLMVSDGDTITVHYHDEDCDGVPADEYDTAGVDCQAPAISGVAVSNVGTSYATISWTTNEIADSVLVWGETTPPTNILECVDLVTDHTFDLEELDPCTEYYFYVSSTDGYGNVVIDDNGGAYYNFTTLQLMVMLEASMDSDPGWSYDGQWAWGVPQGNGGDPTGGQTGDSVVGYNLAGQYGNNLSEEYATTQVFDCTGASQAYLGFYKWLGVESSSYDHAAVEISNDGGATWEAIWNHEGSSVSGGSWEYVEYDISTWAAGNSNVQLRWTMGTTDGSATYCGWNVDDVMVSYTAPCNVPILTYDSHTIDDSMGNNDGEINGGESIAMTVTLANVGLDAHNISATISSTNSHVTFTNDSVTFPDIPQSGSAVANAAFEFDVSVEAEDGEAIPFTIAWSSDENSGTASMTEMVVAPTLTVAGYQIIEISGGEFDGIWEPGETVQIMVDAMNSGYGIAHNVMGSLSSDMPGDVTIDDGEATWPDIAGGAIEACDSPYFQVTASNSIPDPSTVTFTVEFEADGYMTTSTFAVDCTLSNFARRYFWNMDVCPGWVAEGQWEHGVPQGNEGDPSSGYTGDNVFGYNLAGDYTNSMSETYLTTDDIDCTGMTDVEVHFMRWLGVESASYDHAAFEVSNDETNWTVIWEHTGSSFTDDDWQPMSYDISAIADNQPTVFLRWVMGASDSSVTYCGWNIDDVEIWADGGSMPPTPTPTPSECINHGDVTLDGEITAGDAQLAFQIALGMVSPSMEEECAADCNGDSEVTAGDAQSIFMAALGTGSCADPLPVDRIDAVRLSEYKNPNQVISENTDIIWVENVTASAGELVAVDVWVDNPWTAIDVFTLDVGFDTDALHLHDVLVGGLDPSWLEFGWNEIEPGMIIVAAFNSGMDYEVPAGSNGTLIQLLFKADVDVVDTGVALLNSFDDLAQFVVID